MPKARKESFINDTLKRVLFSLSAFFLNFLISYVIDPYSEYWESFFNRSSAELINDILITLFCSATISEFSLYISRRLNQTLPWNESPKRRLFTETSLIVLMALFVNLVITLLCFSSENSMSSVLSFSLSVEETKGMIHWLVVSLVIGFMIMGINTGNYLIVNWKNEALRSAELNQLASEAELQALKLQIDPHFVFNNLSVLSELILEDQQLGYQYAENFSKIYRYMLLNSKKDVIRLEEELRFLQAYIFLIHQRMGDGVQFKIDIIEDSYSLSLPPMTLQLLVENALKHNKTNKKQPLHIHIFSTDQSELVVENTLQPITGISTSSGLGLKNIYKRYQILSGKQPDVLHDEHHFRVTLPLLEMKGEF